IMPSIMPAIWPARPKPIAVVATRPATGWAISGCSGTSGICLSQGEKPKGSSPAASSGGILVAFASCPAGVFIVLLRCFQHRAMRHGIGGVLVDARLDLGAEVADEALDRPGRGVAERADRV